MIEKQNILVTGGASGIGKSIVIDRVNKGDSVVFTDLNKEAGQKLVKEINAKGKSVVFFQHDVTSWEETNQLIHKVISILGHIDLLVHSAGITNRFLFDEITLDTWKQTFSVNLTGLFYTIKAVIPEMLNNNGGNIVIIGSGSAITGSGGGVHYSSSKGGAFGLMRAIAKEYSHMGIRINLVAPRVIETDMLTNLYPDNKSKQALKDKIPVRKLGTLSDTTNAINFLAAKESNYIQGQVLLLDGGRTHLS